jgi:hypothetical protein
VKRPTVDPNKKKLIDKGRQDKLTQIKGKLTPEQQRRLDQRAAAIKQQQLATIKTTKPGQKPNPSKKLVPEKRFGPGGVKSGRDGLRLTGDQTNTLVNGFQNTTNPADKQALNNILNHKGLSEAQERRVENLISNELRKNPPNRQLIDALRTSLVEEQNRDRANNFVNSLKPGNLGGHVVPPFVPPPPGVFPPPGQQVNVLPPPCPGIDPYLPSCVFPTDPGGSLTGPGFITQIDCGPSVDPGVIPTDNFILPPSGGDPGLDLTTADVNAATAVLHTTRFLRISNATDQQITVHVQYRATTQSGDVVWYPGDPADSEQSITYEVGPGEVVDVYDNDWRINADVVRVWAESSTKNWLEFKTKDLLLVPETDEAGIHGYLDQQVQTFVLAIR